MKCIDCRSFNMRSADKAAPGYAKLGMGKCDMKTHGTATFITTTYARECPSFIQADAETISKREQYINQEPA